ncbi:MAG: CoA transferase [Deltaproteobacteria bacterium]|nr:CoA transferase [Deltaproteobacteria bacterium]
MKPLEGLRVLSVEQFAAAPYGTMFLADLGAEVIKIENAATGGDTARQVGPYFLGPGDSLYFQGWNLNKRSVLLDLKSDAGRAAFERLVGSADAVINNLRGDQPAKLGLDYASLSKINRAVVCLHISAYGRDNERAARPGYDFLMQAEAGLMSLTGEPDGPPSRFGPSIIDYMTGVVGMVGLLSCLRQAQRTGRGCDVDTCLFDVALHQLNYAATWYLNEGYVSTRQPRSAHFFISPVQTVPTADGWIFVMCMTDKFWETLLEGLGRRDLGEDPRFADQIARHQNRAALTAILEAEFRKQPSGYWLAKLSSELPIAPVYDLPQALENPFVRRTGMVRSVPHPRRPNLRVLASPIKVDGARPEQKAAPPAGADDEALLGAAAGGGEPTRRGPGS